MYRSSTPSYDRQRAADVVLEDDDNRGSLAPLPTHRLRSLSSSSWGLVRKASRSIKGLVNRRPSAAAEDAAREGTDSAIRPTTSHSVLLNRIRTSKSLRHTRSFFSDLTQEPFSLRERPDDPADSHQSLAILGKPIDLALRPGTAFEPPIIPEHTGAAAKAAAAMQNEYYAANLQGKWLDPSTYDAANDHESGIGIAVFGPDHDSNSPDAQLGEEHEIDASQDISRVDFITELPLELATHILAFLDASALGKAAAVSRSWQKVTSDQHVWRESCLRETTTTYAMSGPVRPNRGLGIPKVSPSSDWKKIYRAKQQLAERWKNGQAQPVYLSGHKDSVYCVQFDEYKLITGSRDKTIRIWDLRTLKCSLIIGPPGFAEQQSLFVDENGDNGHYAADSNGERMVESWPATVSFSTYHDRSILCLQYDDEILVTGSSDASCILYDIKKGYEPIRRLTHHTAAVLDLAFDSKHIVTCSKDISICVWDRATGAMLRQLKGHTGPVNAVQMRGNTIVSCSGDYRVKLWNIDTGKNIREFSGHTKGLACSQFSEDGRFVASAGNDQVIRIWDANTGELIREMDAHKNLVRSLHIDSVSGRLVSASYDTDIKVWDMETGSQLLDFPHWHSSWVLSAKNDYRRIVSSGQDAKILIMDFGADVEGIELLESEQPNGCVNEICA